MHFLYGITTNGSYKLAATFDTEQQMLAYVNWATLSEKDGLYKFEQGTPLSRYQKWIGSAKHTTEDDPATVDHNPSPSML